VNNVFRRVAGLSSACLAAALLCASSTVAAEEPRASEVKAAFLTSFAKFAEWPSDTLPDGAPITFCVMGDEDVASAIERLVRSRPAPGRELKVVRLKVDILSRRQESTLPACHLLYASGVDVRQWPVLLAAIEGKPVFSVSDSPGFAERGGLAALYVELNRMRFAINVDTLRRSGLHLSATVLSLAKIVKDDPNGARR
jgi:YfiR/HmsC-like